MLPSGEVTFVLTDIEGSTRLFRRLGNDYVVALSVHNRLVRQAFGAAGGCEVKNDGDSFFYAFGTAAAAARGAVALQRALSAAPWPEDAEFRVRVGIHTSAQAGPLGRDYISLDVNRAARITAAARGGQVLASEATAKRLTDAGALYDLQMTAIGSCWLKDFDEMETLYALSTG